MPLHEGVMPVRSLNNEFEQWKRGSTWETGGASLKLGCQRLSSLPPLADKRKFKPQAERRLADEDRLVTSPIVVLHQANAGKPRTKAKNQEARFLIFRRETYDAAISRFFFTHRTIAARRAIRSPPSTSSSFLIRSVFSRSARARIMRADASNPKHAADSSLMQIFCSQQS